MAFSGLPYFGDLDQREAYDRSYDALYNINTQNFVVEFNNEDAKVAVDLDETRIKQLFGVESRDASIVRWINIFSPEKQKGIIDCIARRYRLSPRLHGILRSKHSTPEHMSAGAMPTRASTHNSQNTTSNGGHNQMAGDLEKSSVDSSEFVEPAPVDINHYKIVDEVWHFCSTDWSEKSLCIGFNSLPNMAVNKPADPGEVKKPSRRGNFKENFRKDSSTGISILGGDLTSKPAGKRVWTWLLLCEDSTVISIYENPFPNHQSALGKSEKESLGIARRNLANVFRQLSKCNEDRRRERPIETLDIRPGLITYEGSSVTILDAPGLLFHYLFDDWYTTYALVAREGKQYAGVLNGLRQDMFKKARLSRVDQLHQTGRQLKLLKRIYESYVVIIERLLSRQRSPGSLEDMLDRRSNGGPDLDRMGQSAVETDDISFKAPLTPKAVVKFERLRDRIKLYALSEIDECIEEKDSLVFLNFNLMTMRQSEAVEKLTRITILLAKVTILFMPVSLMTGYFSVNIKDLEDVYSVKTYWVCFVVIMAISFVFLVVFGVISQTLEGTLIYRSARTAAWQGMKGFLGKTRMRKQGDKTAEKEPED